jgi:PKD repeat protein
MLWPLLTPVLVAVLIGSVAAVPVSGGAQPPGLERAIAVQEKYNPRLMAKPLVVGTAVGLTAEGWPIITIFTERPGASVPQALEGVPVAVEVTGMFVAREDPAPNDRWPRPVPIGVSTGHPDITAGTIGARVKDAQGNVYALSNNHVYADSNGAQLGDSALQPGPYDGGTDPADKIGELHDFEPLRFDGSNNTIDAAIASTTAAEVGYSTPSEGYGTPSATIASASLGLNVQKFGRTTGWTHGEVSQINATVDVCYEQQCNPAFCRCKKLARFVDQIVITPGTFSDGGDSGSLIVTDDGNKNPVGLLFAGSETHTIANPIGYVLDRFNVTIDDGSGGGGNLPPTADFTYTTSDLTAYFTDQSADSDGSVVAWDWDFGDGNTSTAQNPSHTYAADGTYTVSLTVTDDGGATDTTSQSVTVSSGGNGITLTATGYKVRGRHHVDLAWSGATSTDVDVYRDGSLVTTTANDGEYTDATSNVGGGSYTYQVCEAGTSTCSNEATVTF